jgi:hypothetical protein
MIKTNRIGLNVTTPADDTMYFKSFRQAIASEDPESNMVIIDGEIGKLIDRVIFSPTQPAVQLEGDIWNEELP